MKVSFRKEIHKRISVFENLDHRTYRLMEDFSNILFEALRRGNTIFTAGNGGSAANAQHITGDIVGRYKLERRGFAGISLTVDPSVMTAVSNDYGYETVFARQLEGLGKKGDVLIVLSSSGNSLNLLKAVEKAKKIGIQTIGVLGNNGGMLGPLLDKCITVSFKESDLVEELSMSLFHIILTVVEQKLVNILENGGDSS